MRKLRFTLSLIAFLSIFITQSINLFAVGGGSSSESSIDIPLPAQNYFATITDVLKIVVDGNRISWNGKIYLEGMLGHAKVSVPFEKINRITIEGPASAVDNGHMLAKVKLIDDQQVEILLLMNSKFYGQTSFGEFEVFIKDLKIIDFK
ncbi:MAG: hypothetical protein JJV97_03545 [SAR324 cluster bacterium]|nr:hypothetical protein [SAR324 cluster bacterium]